MKLQITFPSNPMIVSLGADHSTVIYRGQVINNRSIKAMGGVISKATDDLPLTKTYEVEMPVPHSPDICAVIAINQIINDELGESHTDSIPRVLDFVKGSWEDAL